MNQHVQLNEIQIEEINKLANDKRHSLCIFHGMPLAHDILSILAQHQIKLLEYPIQSEDYKSAFSAVIMYDEVAGEEQAFIGVNTADYFDRQVFAIAHELYHYYTKAGSHISWLDNSDNSIVEAKANRFAAEFLFPESELKNIMMDEYKMSSLVKIPMRMLLRFIARLQCTWWLPYRSIVKRLREIAAISEDQYNDLYRIDERNLDSEYGRLGIVFDEEIFRKLNCKTNTIGTSMRDIDIIVRNFENGLIDEDKLVETLSLFDKSPDDFGYSISLSDADELDAFLSGGNSGED